MTTKVAVIGAGALGLMAIKTFEEDGFDVTGFESRPYVGGLWKDSSDSTISVHATTRFNSSKYRAAISDFPFSEDVDDFPTAPQLHQYLTDYSAHFGLTDKIQLNTKIIDLNRDGDRWALTVESQNGARRMEHFDKVAVASGSFFQPKLANIDDADKFAGSIIHSIDYHGSEPYANKNVLVIGVHASAQDVVTSLKETANKAYMSHRSGLILFPRYMSNGAAYDQSGNLTFVLIQTFMMTWFPRVWHWIFDKIVQSLSKSHFDVKPEWNFLPAPSLAVSSPLVGDNLYSLLQSGFATPVGAIDRVTGAKSIRLTDGTELSDVDAIVHCTGYDFAVPFIPPTSPHQPFSQPGQPPNLYRNIFPLSSDARVRNSLAFLGQSAIPYPGFVQFEMLAQSVSQIWRGKHTLPSLAKMQRWHADHLAWRSRMVRIYGASSTFYTAFQPFADHFRWLDETSGSGIFRTFDWAWFNRRSWALWWRDRELYRLCMKGLFTPSVFRLFDEGGRKSWEKAREQVLRDNEAATSQKVRRVKEMEMNGKKNV